MAWEANMDIQPVFNHYKAVAYMSTYLSKTENECSVAMKQAAIDVAATMTKLSRLQMLTLMKVNCIQESIIFYQISG